MISPSIWHYTLLAWAKWKENLKSDSIRSHQSCCRQCAQLQQMQQLWLAFLLGFLLLDQLWLHPCWLHGSKWLSHLHKRNKAQVQLIHLQVQKLPKLYIKLISQVFTCFCFLGFLVNLELLTQNCHSKNSIPNKKVMNWTSSSSFPVAVHHLPNLTYT
jgi:hypothetical protein